MRVGLLLSSGTLLVLGLACSGGADELPPPPPPPDGVVTPKAEVPPEPPPPVDPVPTASAALLPPPWGDLGLAYTDTTVLLVEPASVVLVTTSAASTDADALFTTWQASLTAAGFTPGAALVAGDDTTQVWTLGQRRIGIAHGLVDTTAYVMAEDQEKLPTGAISARTTDGAVRILLTARTSTAVTTPPGEPAPRSGGELPGRDHAFVPAKDKGSAFSPTREGKSGGKKPGGKGKGKKAD